MSIPAPDSTSAAISLRRRVATYDARPAPAGDFVGRRVSLWRDPDVDSLLEGTAVGLRRTGSSRTASAPSGRPSSSSRSCRRFWTVVRGRGVCGHVLASVAAAAVVAQVPAHALAAPPTEVQRPSSSAAPSAEVTSTSAPRPASESGPIAPAPPPLTLAPRTVAQDRLSLTGTSLWAGLVGRRVVLGVEDGGLVDGRLLSQSIDHLAIALRENGQVVSVEKRRISGINVPPSAEVPPSDGTGLIAGGGVLLGLGVPVTIAGLIFGFWSPFLGLMFLPGPVAVGAGIPMVVVGSRRRADYRRAMIKATPNLSLNRNGASGGLTLRF